MSGLGPARRIDSSEHAQTGRSAAAAISIAIAAIAGGLASPVVATSGPVAGAASAVGVLVLVFAAARYGATLYAALADLGFFDAIVQIAAAAVLGALIAFGLGTALPIGAACGALAGLFAYLRSVA